MQSRPPDVPPCEPVRAVRPVLLYDGECPVCSAYGAAVAGADGSNYRAIDARGDDPLVREAVAAGLNLDEGMVVHHQGKFHHGAEALRFIAERDRERGLWGMLNRGLFKRRALSRLLYPVLRAGRNALLRVRGKPKIHQGR